MTITKVANKVCRYFDISKDQLILKSRKNEILEPRQMFHYLAYKHTNQSLSKIGSYKRGCFTHATVINSKKKVENICSYDKSFKKIVDELEMLITK